MEATKSPYEDYVGDVLEAYYSYLLVVLSVFLETEKTSQTTNEIRENNVEKTARIFPINVT